MFASTREGAPTSLKKVGIIYKADLDDMNCHKSKKGNGVSKGIAITINSHSNKNTRFLSNSSTPQFLSVSVAL